jgi:hypothetical protein
MNFGLRFIIIVVLGNIPLLCLATNFVDDSIQAVEFAEAKAVKAYNQLETKALQCDIKKHVDVKNIKQQLPSISNDKDKKKLSVAIGYLSHLQFIQCVKKEESALLYSTTVVRKILDTVKDANIKISPSFERDNNTRSAVALGSISTLLIGEVRYMNLPESSRKQLEQIKEFKTPFDAIKLLQDLGMMP